jgi:competence protein ComEC
LMRHGVAWLAKIPGSDIPLPALPVLLILTYYALLALPLIPTARTRLKWAYRGGAAAACATGLMLPLLIGFAPRGGRGGELKLTLLYVGAGQCAVLELPSGKNILIDAGSSSITDLERRCLEPFFRHEGISRIDSIYISHANFDHFSAVAQTAEDYAPREILVTPQFKDHAAKNYPARLMLRKLTQLKYPAKQITAGQKIQLDDDCALEVLWPPEDPHLDANNSCEVLRLTFKGRSILFTGDIQSPAESALLADPALPLRSDILIAPHHGSAEETTARFLDAVGATTILASNDRTLSGKQKEFDKLIAADPTRALLRTDRCGAITLRIMRDGTLKISRFLNR